MSISVPGQFAGLSIAFAFLFWALTVAVHVVFAVGVFRDAEGLRRSRTGPLLAGPFWWMSATLIGGVFVAGVYLVVHHSTLRVGSQSEPAKGVGTDLD